MSGIPDDADWGVRKLVLFDDPAFDRHVPGFGHPEDHRRLPVIRLALAGHPWEVRPGRWAEREELERVHSREHVDCIRDTAGKYASLDADTMTSPGSAQAAFLAAGAAVEAAGIAAKGGQAFVLCRPPGHHATRDQAMGFCLFNNAAVAAAHLAAQGLRVAIFDPDVHHGNGTQDIFYDRADVLYASTHHFPFYPGSGWHTEQGEGAGRGYTLNIPIPGGADDRWWVSGFKRLILPAFVRFSPDVCIVSAGFDGMASDPLGGMRFTPEAMAWFFQEISARWPTMAVLEGGYNRDTLGVHVRMAARALAGVRFTEPDVWPSAPWSDQLDAFKHPLIA